MNGKNSEKVNFISPTLLMKKIIIVNVKKCIFFVKKKKELFILQSYLSRMRVILIRY